MTGTRSWFDSKDSIFIGTLVLVHIAFAIIAAYYGNYMMGDSLEYIREGVHIQENGSFSCSPFDLPGTTEELTLRHPLYPLLLLGTYVASFGHTIIALQIVQGLLSIFNIWCVRKTLLYIGFQKKYDWLLLLLTVAYPAQFINANTVAPDILLQTFSVLYFTNFVSFCQERRIRSLLFMSLALIAGMMVKPVLYPFVWIHLAAMLLLCAKQRLVSVRSIAILLFPVAALLSYQYWNYQRTDRFHFSSNQAQNASYYYYPFIMEKYGMDSANRFLEKEKRDYWSYSEFKDRYNHANKRGMELLEQNFFPYMVFHLKNAARIFVEPGKAEIDLFTGKLSYKELYSKKQTGFFATWKARGMAGMGDYLRNNPSMFFVVLVLLFNCVRLVGFYWFLRDRSIHRIIRLFILLFAVYFAVAAGPIANTRYFLPVSLVVIGCAAVELARKLESRGENKTPPSIG